MPRTYRRPKPPVRVLSGRWFFRALIRGFIAVLPILATLAIVGWLASILEKPLGSVLEHVLPKGWYVAPMGALLSLVIILMIGVFLDVWIVQGVLHLVEDVLDHIPFVKGIFSSFRDLAAFFSTLKANKGSQVVMIRLGGTITGDLKPPTTDDPAQRITVAAQGMEVMGLVTREDFSELPASLAGEGKIAVFIPLSYAWGGFTVLVSRSAVRPVDMSVEDAMRFAVTAGMAVKQAESTDKK